MEERYYTLEIVSQRASLTPAAVRRYTRLGFIQPRARRGRQALYGEAELARLRKIVRLTRDLGLNLAGVEVVLHLTDAIDALQREMAALRKEES